MLKFKHWDGLIASLISTGGQTSLIINDEKEQLNLTSEQLKVLDNYYSDFVRNGIGLDEEKKSRLKKINEELSMLNLKFGNNLRKETNAIG